MAGRKSLGGFIGRGAEGRPNQPAYQRWREHGGGIRPCERKCRADPARVPLRGATWLAPRVALQCLGAVAPPNAREGKARRKRPLRAAENRSPAGLRSDRIVPLWPWRQGSFQKNVSGSDRTRALVR